MGKPADFADILNGVMWAQVFLGTVLVALRMYTRQYIVRNIGWDDVLMLVNLVSLHLFTNSNLVVRQELNKLTFEGYLYRLCWLRVCWHHLWCWQTDGRHCTTRPQLLQIDHVGSHRSGHLHHGNSCLQGFSSTVSPAHCYQEMAHCYPLVLHSEYDSALHHHNNAPVHSVCTIGVLMGSDNRRRILLAELHRGRSNDGCLVCSYGLRSRSPPYVTPLRITPK